MSEASGTIVIYAPDNVLTALRGEEGVSWSAIAELFSVAQAGSPLDISPDMAFYEGEVFAHEGLQYDQSSLLIDISGAVWMDLARALVMHAREVELYGFIEDETGYLEFYALSEHARFCEAISSADDGSNNSTRRCWIEEIPDGVKERYGSTFAFAGDE